MPVSNVCPHCDDAGAGEAGTHVRCDEEARSARSARSRSDRAGRGRANDPELPTAKQASERFEMGRNFANKMWNATRFLLMNLEGYTPGPVDVATLPTEDRWILSRLATTTNAVTDVLEGYHFSEVARLRLRLRLVGVLRLVHRDDEGPAQRPPHRERSAARADRRARRHPAARAAGDAVRGRIALARPERSRPETRLAGASGPAAKRGDRAVAGVTRGRGCDAARGPLRPNAGTRPRRARGSQPLPGGRQDAPRRVGESGDAIAARTSPNWRRSSGRWPASPTSPRPDRDQAEAGRQPWCGRSSRRTCRWWG